MIRKLIEEIIEKYYREDGEYYSRDREDESGNDLEMDEEIKSALEETKWIPCSERMPEDNTDVIVCFYSGTVTEMRYWGNGIFQGIYEHTAKTIVAWMPLPEPYKGE